MYANGQIIDGAEARSYRAGGAGSVGKALDVPVKQGEVVQKMAQLQHMLGDLECSTQKLISLLRPVSRLPPPPSDTKGVNTSLETEVGQSLEALRSRMANLDAEINGAIDRLEI